DTFYPPGIRGSRIGIETTRQWRKQAAANPQEIRTMKLMIHDYESRNVGKSTQEFDLSKTLIRYWRRLRPLAAGWIAILLLSSEAFAATFRFASTSNRIY